MKIIARFQPQAWQRDNAIDVDAEGEIEWDVTEEILAMGREKALALEDDQYETDELRESKNAPEWVRDWSGPFYINVAESIAAYYFSGGEADAILKDLVETIEATGGVIKNQDGTIAPVGDEDWIDLGSVYESACVHLGREMKIEEVGNYECAECGADDHPSSECPHEKAHEKVVEGS